jgi:TRAP-type uncharacterized transport system fused permease subunit
MLWFGHLRAGLAQVNVVSSMLFAGMTGSSTAEAAGLGTIHIKMMRKKGYDVPFAAALPAAFIDNRSTYLFLQVSLLLFMMHLHKCQLESF